MQGQGREDAGTLPEPKPQDEVAIEPFAGIQADAAVSVADVLLHGV
jgi:hypothetical protein